MRAPAARTRRASSRRAQRVVEYSPLARSGVLGTTAPARPRRANASPSPSYRPLEGLVLRRDHGPADSTAARNRAGTMPNRSRRLRSVGGERPRAERRCIPLRSCGSGSVEHAGRPTRLRRRDAAGRAPAARVRRDQQAPARAPEDGQQRRSRDIVRVEPGPRRARRPPKT